MTTPAKGILQKPHDYEENETPVSRLKWDENKLKITEKQKEQAFMKIDEPNTPYIQYDPATDTVLNWEVLPENLRAAAQEEPDEFSLNEGGSCSKGKTILADNNMTDKEPDEWKQVDERERQSKEEAARKRHEKFEQKRAQHYSHVGDVLHYTFDEEDTN
ncbi:MAG: hypothetical protein EXX96DRAFT_550891 [Benjaminiella poitrasii]|nr:MAG: hypothetical protein EXX96DRAFT_550891 [Benjaminiella poitrasii]